MLSLHVNCLCKPHRKLCSSPETIFEFVKSSFFPPYKNKLFLKIFIKHLVIEVNFHFLSFFSAHLMRNIEIIVAVYLTKISDAGQPGPNSFSDPAEYWGKCKSQTDCRESKYTRNWPSSTVKNTGYLIFILFTSIPYFIRVSIFKI